MSDEGFGTSADIDDAEGHVFKAGHLDDGSHDDVEGHAIKGHLDDGSSSDLKELFRTRPVRVGTTDAEGHLFIPTSVAEREIDDADDAEGHVVNYGPLDKGRPD
jgi:hypothetical protein